MFFFSAGMEPGGGLFPLLINNLAKTTANMYPESKDALRGVRARMFNERTANGALHGVDVFGLR